MTMANQRSACSGGAPGPSSVLFEADRADGKFRVDNRGRVWYDSLRRQSDTENAPRALQYKLSSDAVTALNTIQKRNVFRGCSVLTPAQTQAQARTQTSQLEARRFGVKPKQSI